jgi:putative DNA primase/helicase
MTSAAYREVVGALSQRGSRRKGTDWQCPTHIDDDPSLSVTDAGDTVLLHCHAGCETDDVLRALGLSWTESAASC